MLTLSDSLRLYPGLPYMERVSVEDDIIPLSESVRLSNGGTTRELPISANQVRQSRWYSETVD